MRGAVVLFLALTATGALWSAFAGNSNALSADNQQALVAEGHDLFLQGCASCHGKDAEGQGTRAPSLIGVGAAAVDFQVSSGRMPLAQPGPEAERKTPQYTQQQIDALAAYVASLAPGPKVPVVDTADGDMALGGELFRTNCAQCHNFAGAGGALSYGKYAPSLKHASNRQIAEAIRTGPESMPVFASTQLSDHDINSIVKYVRYLDHANDPGGSAIGHLGPVPEGLVIWLIGIGGLIGVTMWIGNRA